jgi:membrane-associated protease RseP (regulator of RpoE activity)
MNRTWITVLSAAVTAFPGALPAQEPAHPAPRPPRAARAPKAPTAVYTFSNNHARIGVVVATAADADSDKIGARLTAVTPGGPAAKAGLQAGDIVTKFNGTSLANAESDDSDESGPGNKLVELAQALDPGDTVQVEYRRGSDAKKATIVADEVRYNVMSRTPAPGNYSFGYTMPDMAPLSPMPGVNVMPRITLGEGWGEGFGEGRGMSVCFGDTWCDLDLVTLTSDLGDYFGTHDGLLVVKATEDSTLPLKSGDVILSIGGRKPTSPSHAMRILRSYDVGESVQIDIMRHQKRTTLTWKVPNPERRELLRERTHDHSRSEQSRYHGLMQRLRELRATREI